MVKGSVQSIGMQGIPVDLCHRHVLNEVGHHMEVQIRPYPLHMVKQAVHDLGLPLVIESVIWTGTLRGGSLLEFFHVLCGQVLVDTVSAEYDEFQILFAFRNCHLLPTV